MGDEDDGLAGGREQLRQILAQHHAGLLVERREGLVHEQNVGFDADAARHVDALAHAHRQLLGIMAGEGGHAHGFQRAHGPVIPFRLGDALELERDAEILDHRVPGKQRAFLKHEGDLVGMGLAIDKPSIDRAGPAGGLEKPAHDVEQGALAAAGGAKKANEFTLLDVERHIVQRQHGVGLVRRAIALRDIVDRDHRIAHQSKASGVRSAPSGAPDPIKFRVSPARSPAGKVRWRRGSGPGFRDP